MLWTMHFFNLEILIRLNLLSINPKSDKLYEFVVDVVQLSEKSCVAMLNRFFTPPGLTKDSIVMCRLSKEF